MQTQVTKNEGGFKWYRMYSGYLRALSMSRKELTICILCIELFTDDEDKDATVHPVRTPNRFGRLSAVILLLIKGLSNLLLSAQSAVPEDASQPGRLQSLGRARWRVSR